MKKLLVFLKDYKKESILAPLFKELEAFMDLLVPLAVARIIDRGIAASDYAYVRRYFIYLILLAALGLGFSVTAQWFAAKASVGFSTNLRQALFDHIQKLSYRQLDELGTDTLITRMTSDVNQTQNGVNMTLRLLLRSPFIVFGSMIMAFTIDVRCALVFAVAIPVLSAVVYGIMIASIPLYGKVQNALDDVTRVTRENLAGVRVIRAFRREEREIRDFDEKNEALTRLNLFVGRLSAVMNPATYVLINIATIILIREGALRVNLGAIHQGDVVALYNYMAQMIVELVKLAALIITINKALASAKRIEKVLDIRPDMAYAPASSEQDAGEKGGPWGVSFSHVSFSYSETGDDALSDISFTAEPGQTVGIIGGTGSGKATLANLIPRFYDAGSGRVLVNGKDVRDYPQGVLTGSVGIVPQRAVMFAGTIRGNLCLGKENASEEELRKAVAMAQAEEVVKAKGGLDGYIEQNGRNLSGGQRQRLTIARALVKEPRILILDDSSSALDYATDAKLRAALRELSGKMTLFIISQRTASMMDADLILVLDDGKLAGAGTHEELLRDCRIYREIYHSQFPPEERQNDSPAE